MNIHRTSPVADSPRSIASARILSFRKKIYRYFERHGRDLPWRKKVTPYRVIVSEVMLQQTQVDRVIPKYREFLAEFPGFRDLAQAPLPKLLALWSGMGYNRRALMLKALAQKVMTEHGGRLPRDREQLLALPGIGKYTAAAVAAFSFNKPVIVLDTNIRRVFIHEFFHDHDDIHDDQLIPLIEATMDRKSPSRWYNALMDYGSMLKRSLENPNRRSAHYVRQSPFENSNRQVRGRILKVLVAASPLTAATIEKRTGLDAVRVRDNLAKLVDEGFIQKIGRQFVIAG